MKINGTKEFVDIIGSYKYENELKLRLLKQGKTFEQGLRDMLHQRNLDIKKHEMEEDEAEKFQSHLGGINATSNRLKIAMKSMEDDMKKQDRRNVISVLIKNKDEDLDKEKINEITDFASEDYEAALNKKLQNKAITRKKSLSKNPILPNTLFNFSKRNSKSNLDFEKEYEFRQTKNSGISSKKINNFLDNNKNTPLNTGGNNMYNSTGNVNAYKQNNPYYQTSNGNQFRSFGSKSAVKLPMHKRNESTPFSNLYDGKFGVSMEIIKSSLTSPSILKHFGKSTRQQYMSNLENIIQNPEAAKLVGAIEKQSRIFKFFRNLDNYEKKLVVGKDNSSKLFHDHEKSSEELKKKFKYVWKNKFL